MENLINKTFERLQSYDIKERISGNNKQNLFVDNLFKYDTTTENGALSHSTTDDLIVDDFSNAGSYRDRDIEDVFETMFELWEVDPDNALKSIFYLRLITRKVKGGFFETENLQKGQGNKDESIKRMLWLAYYQPKVFYKNLWLIPLVGSWKDLFTLMTIDFEGRIDRNKIFELIKKGLADEYNIDLVKKYLPAVKSNSKIKTNRGILLNSVAKQLATYLFSDEVSSGQIKKTYRKFKSSGKAHTFQQKISNGLYEDIDFNLIPGKALNLMVNSNFLSNHNLEDEFIKWLDSKENINYNGYIYELTRNITKNNDYNKSLNIIQRHTINKQYQSLIDKVKKDTKCGDIKGNVLCALDTSGSMMTSINKSGVSAFDVCIGLGIYFSDLNQGYFHNIVAMFDNTSSIKKLNGDFVTKYNSIVNDNIAWGSTNFLSVIDLLVDMRKKQPNIPLEDYPDTILVISDMQFNDTNRCNTNHEEAIRRLEEVGLTGIKFIWWDVTSFERKDYPSKYNDMNTFFFSGFDGSIINELLGFEIQTTPEGKIREIDMTEIVQKVYNQDILKQLKL